MPEYLSKNCNDYVIIEIVFGNANLTSICSEDGSNVGIGEGYKK